MVALLTGFEPYGGRGRNPASEVAQRLHGASIGGTQIISHTLPVALQPLPQLTQQLLDEYQPELVISLGLAPGTPMIRLERVAVNIADFAIADNQGEQYADMAIINEGPAALFTRLPIRAIEQELLEAGIPTHISDSAGTYLCNAVMYQFLYLLANSSAASGFIHLPYLPSQVAELIVNRPQNLELYQRADLASMDLETMVEAVRIALVVALTRA